MKYHIRASQTNPPCLTEEGKALSDQKDKLDELATVAKHLADGCRLLGKDYWFKQLRDLFDELSADSLKIEEELADDLVE